MRGKYQGLLLGRQAKQPAPGRRGLVRMPIDTAFPVRPHYEDRVDESIKTFSPILTTFLD
jgi:hypothetical protein